MSRVILKAANDIRTHVLRSMTNERLVSAVVGQVFSSGGSFTINILLARNISLSAFGTWALLWVIIYSANALHNALVQIPSQILLRDTNGIVRPSFLASMILYSILLSVALGVATAALALLLVECSVIVSLGWIDLISSTILACGMMLVEYNRKMLLALDLHATLRVTEIARSLLGIAAVQMSLSFQAATIITGPLAGLGTVTLIAGLVGTIRAFRFARFYNISLSSAFSESWAYSRWLAAHAVVSRSAPSATYALAATRLGASEIAGLQGVSQLINVFNVVFQTMQTSLPLSINDLARTAGIGTAMGRAKKLTFAFALLFGAGLLAAALMQTMIVGFVLGPNYVRFSSLMPILLFGYACTFAAFPIGCVAHAIRRSDIFAVSNAIAVIASLLLLGPLVGRYGIVGAGCTIAGGQAVDAAITIALVIWRLRDARLHGSA